MIKRRFLMYSIMLLLAVFLLTACSTSERPVQAKIESGVVNENYTGNVQPTIEKYLKLSEEEKKNGVKKIKIKCGVEKEIPIEEDSQSNDNSEQPSSNSGGGTKPKI